MNSKIANGTCKAECHGILLILVAQTSQGKLLNFETLLHVKSMMQILHSQIVNVIFMLLIVLPCKKVPNWVPLKSKSYHQFFLSLATNSTTSLTTTTTWMPPQSYSPYSSSQLEWLVQIFSGALLPSVTSLMVWEHSNMLLYSGESLFTLPTSLSWQWLVIV